jgi:hypothetical protein
MRSSRKEDADLSEVLVRLDSIAERLDAIEQRQVTELAQ